MPKKTVFAYSGLWAAPVVHFSLYVMTLFTTPNAFFASMTIAPTLLAMVGIVAHRAGWMYMAFLVAAAPGLYIFFAGNGYSRLFIASPVLFLLAAILLHSRQRNLS